MLTADFACRLPGSNLLLGLPVVLDTNNDAIREGQRVSTGRSSPEPEQAALSLQVF